MAIFAAPSVIFLGIASFTSVSGGQNTSRLPPLEGELGDSPGLSPNSPSNSPLIPLYGTVDMPRGWRGRPHRRGDGRKCA